MVPVILYIYIAVLSLWDIPRKNTYHLPLGMPAAMELCQPAYRVKFCKHQQLFFYFKFVYIYIIFDRFLQRQHFATSMGSFYCHDRLFFFNLMDQTAGFTTLRLSIWEGGEDYTQIGFEPAISRSQVQYPNHLVMLSPMKISCDCHYNNGVKLSNARLSKYNPNPLGRFWCCCF